jgi:predicted aminopeptidase
MKKKITWIIAAMLLLVVTSFYEFIGYGISQAKGQFKVLWNAQPIVDLLENPQVNDSVKQKLLMVNEIRSFAFDSLGLTPNKNYTTFYDQHGKDILWVVTACAPYKFEPKEWSFPIIGSFTYKGFFDIDKANNLAQDLKGKGFDVEMSSVRGWSTLGWFKDPVLSNMLNGSVGAMSNTLIHELTHSTLFIPDSMTFNENLASFVGRKGALKFLESKYGKNTQQVETYANRLKDSEKFTKYMVLGASQLDSIYGQIEGEPIEQKEVYKNNFLALFSANIDTVSFINPDSYKELFIDRGINNAGFISFLKYRERQHEFDEQFAHDFGCNLSKFISYWREQYPN